MIDMLKRIITSVCGIIIVIPVFVFSYTWIFPIVLAAVGVNMFFNNISLYGVGLFLILFVVSFKQRRDPLLYLGVSAIAGFILSYIK